MGKTPYWYFRFHVIALLFISTTFVKLSESGESHKESTPALCANNGHRFSYRQIEANDHSRACLIQGANKPCLPVNPPKTCSVIHFTVAEFSFAIIKSLLIEEHNVDQDHAIRRIVINLSENRVITGSNNTTGDFTKIGEIIDDFLLLRPWWLPVKEPYEWMEEENNEIIFDRYHHSYEPYLRSIVHKQYPDGEGCSKSAMLVGRMNCAHPGWFSVLAFYSTIRDQYPYAIDGMYFPAKKIPKNVWVEDSDCPDTENKWTCAFLPSTSCDFPDVIRTCSESSCHSKTNVGFHSLMTSSDANGDYVPDAEKNNYGKSAVVSTPHHHRDPPPFPIATITDYSKANTAGAPVPTKDITYTYRFLLRQTSFYRSRVAKMLAAFYATSSPVVHDTSRCATVHIRRGDRSPEGVDPKTLKEMCYNSSHNLLCNGKECKISKDYGCESIPFGALELKDIPSKVELLVGPEVKTLFVFSDDIDWIRKESELLKDTHPDYNVYFLDDPHLRKRHLLQDSEKLRYGLEGVSATESGVYLFASLKLASQCEAFVGHFGSGATKMYHYYMCTMHAGMHAVCPPTFDLRLL